MDHIQQLLYPGLDLSLRQIVKGGEELEILSAGKPPVKASLIRGDKTEGRSGLLALLYHVVTIDVGISLGGQDEGAQNLYQSGLTGTVGPQETQYLAFANLYVHAVKCS